MTTLNLSLITTLNKEFLQKQMDIDKSASIACGKSLKGNLQSTLLNYQVKLKVLSIGINISIIVNCGSLYFKLWI